MDQTRRNLLKAAGVCAVCAVPAVAAAAPADDAKAIIDNMLTRRSVRAYSPEPVSESDIQTILKCAMAAPSAANEQPWDFVVVTDGDALAKVGPINHYASYAANAPLAILVCLNKEKEKFPGMSVLDIGMCAENIMLAAHALGLGSVFTGIYPEDERMKGFRELFGLPENVTPMGLIVIGHPDGTALKEKADPFKQENIHMQTWGGK